MADTDARSTNLNRRTVALTVHICAESTLTSWADRNPTPTDLVLTPEQLHRRNLKHVLATANQPRSSLQLVPPVEVAKTVAVGDASHRLLDRADRLRLLEDILADPTAGVKRLRTVFGTNLPTRAESLEAAREELEVVAGGANTRRDILCEVAENLPAPADRETMTLLDGLRAVERKLVELTERHVSAAPLFRAGYEALSATDGAAWYEAFPTVQRLSIAGVSTLASPLLDFLGHVAAFTDVDVHLFLRAGTGPRIADRLQTRLRAESTVNPDVTVTTDNSGTVAPTPPVAELVATTRREEARAAIAVVTALIESGVSVSDIALVARDVDRYERPLKQAAHAYGRQLSVWTQLALKHTLPYRLLLACGDLLSAASTDEVDLETLLAPFDHQWIPPDAKPLEGWPLAPKEIATIRRALNNRTSTSLDAWSNQLDELDNRASSGVQRLIHWIRRQPTSPTPEAVEETFLPLLEAYDDLVLPERLTDDNVTLTETSQTAWALERSLKLLGQVRGKYADWRDRGHVTDSWKTVVDICDAIATIRPGRREHHNAERIDVLDATDTWLREYPYVVALGLVDGEWPERPDGAFPPTFRDAVVEATGPAGGLGVHGSWTEQREIDHFVDAVRTATQGLVLTRFIEDAEGITYRRSPLLDHLTPNPSVVEETDITDLLAADRQLPDPLSDVFDTNSEVNR